VRGRETERERIAFFQVQQDRTEALCTSEEQVAQGSLIHFLSQGCSPEEVEDLVTHGSSRMADFVFLPSRIGPACHVGKTPQELKAKRGGQLSKGLHGSLCKALLTGWIRWHRGCILM
jgi:hypothetical protein